MFKLVHESAIQEQSQVASSRTLFAPQSFEHLHSHVFNSLVFLRLSHGFGLQTQVQLF
jgi:hypothetical protein